jgi:hypothetical protein
MDYLKNNKKTMWLYARNAEKELKNQEMLIHTQKTSNQYQGLIALMIQRDSPETRS